MIAIWNHWLEHRFPLRPPPLSRSPRLGGTEKLKVEPDEVGAKRLAAPLATASQPVSALAVAKRLACDQLIMAPLGLFVFITFFAICQGLEFEAYRERLKTLYVPLLLANYSVWPLIQTVNFRFLPLRYRVPFAASCGVRDA